MRVIFMYHDEEPHGSSYTPGSLPDPAEAFKQARSLFLTQRVNQAPIKLDARMKIMELRNQDVELPRADNTLHWCKMFKLSDINRKHHLIRVSSFVVPLARHLRVGFVYPGLRGSRLSDFLWLILGSLVLSSLEEAEICAGRVR